MTSIVVQEQHGDKGAVEDKLERIISMSL